MRVELDQWFEPPMRSRRFAMFACVVAGATALAQAPATRPLPTPHTLYAAVGAELTRYDLDVTQATLTRRESVTLPANVQEAAWHPARGHLYVAWSNGGASYAGSGGGARASGDRHGVTAFRIDPASGALAQDGQAITLRARPIHVTTDVPGTHLLVAYNAPSGVTVHDIRPDGKLGGEIPPAARLDGGIYGHQVRVLPSNRAAVLVTRGNAPTTKTPEDPGALKVFAYKDGVLSNGASIAPHGGFGFQSRHLDFHPTRPWAFLSLERQNTLEVFSIVGDNTLGQRALYSKSTLAQPGSARPAQAASTVRMHPSGRVVYVGNRAGGTTTDAQGVAAFAGGENSIAVFAIDQRTGEPSLVQSADTHGFFPRTFSLDSGGRVLVVGNQNPMPVREDGRVRTVPANLAVFRISDDGRLTFARTYDLEANLEAGRSLFWMGIVPLR